MIERAPPAEWSSDASGAWAAWVWRGGRSLVFLETNRARLRHHQQEVVLGEWVRRKEEARC